MADKTFAKGIMAFAAKPTQPDWVIGTMIISLADLKEWVNGEGAQHLTEYKDKKQLKLQITKTKDGKLSVAVDNWKKPESGTPAGYKEDKEPEDFRVADDNDSEQLPF